MVLQFALSVAAGCVAIWWDHHLWGYDPTKWNFPLALWGALVGFAFTRGVTFLFVWCRYGWLAARSMRMLD